MLVLTKLGIVFISIVTSFVISFALVSVLLVVHMCMTKASTKWLRSTPPLALSRERFSLPKVQASTLVPQHTKYLMTFVKALLPT